MSITLIFTNGDVADHVICSQCDTEMLLSPGTEVCPVCGNEGCLGWVDNDKPEVMTNDWRKVMSSVHK